MTEFQRQVLETIRNHPGDDPEFLCMGWTSTAAFGRAAHVLMDMGLVYYSDAFSKHREWWPVNEQKDG